MEWLALLTPVVLALLALLIWKTKITWFEVLIPIVASVIVIMIMKWSMVKSLTIDTEYKTSHIISAEHIDEWDEYIHKTCSYTTSHGSGKSRYTTTHYYDCSYVDNHPETWLAHTNSGEVLTISKEYYIALKQLFHNESFVEMNRNYHHIDGDAHMTAWPNTFVSVVPIDSSDEYDNKAQTAETVFHFEELDSIQKKTVFEYPAIINSKQKACIGCDTSDDKILRKINGLYGKTKQIKIFVIVFKNKQESIAELQRKHWRGSNKNELIICVDANNKWAKSFSWSDDKRLESMSNQIFMNEKLTMRQKLIQLKRLVPITWKRKEFKDFDYIDVQLTPNQLIWIHFITFFVSVICIAWGIMNKIDQDTFSNRNVRRY